jgi:DNA modification methylase
MVILEDEIRLIELHRLRRLFRDEAQNAWDIGDEINRLVGIGFKVKNLALRFYRRRARLSEYRRTAREFPLEERDLSAPHTHYLIARRVVKKGLASNLFRTREIITKKGLGQPRDAVRYFAGLRADAENRSNRERVAGQLQRVIGKGVINRCHCEPFQAVVERIEAGTVQIFYLDPPYSNHESFADGTMSLSRSAARIACDNSDAESALAQTLDGIRTAPRILKPNGVALLWQSTVGPPEITVLQAIDAAGLTIEREVWWNKSHPQLEDGEGTYATQAERVYVLRRKGDVLKNHAPELHRGNVLTISPVVMRARTAHEHHIFEKPAELNRYFVQKHSYEGDLIVDAFGCSGSFSVAAIELGRRWVYCESNRDNFSFGSRRIAGCQAAQEKKSA